MNYREVLVSVIVPIYNVEKYLDNCLKTIECQTHSNIQVILVNDGSPDNSRLICEEYCEKDSRFVLVNKENGGLASARNAGLDIVKGDYIICVDSDDWIEPNMIETLLVNIIKNNADLSVCSFFENFDNKIMDEFFSEKVEVISQEDAIKRMITPGKFYGFAWNKMYRTRIVEDQRYNERILKGEDSPFSCDYILKCHNIVVQDIPLYHYRTNSISISRSRFNLGKMTVLDSYRYIIDKLIEHDFSQEIVDMQKVQYANQLLSLRTNIILSGKEQFLPQLSIIDNQIEEYKKLYISSRVIDKKHKIAFFMALRFKRLFEIICKLYGGKE